ncbi:MAG: nickel pincer cofactor biosynthesis protein LarB [Chitinivibrionales bacterium]|nr:nickel pincer cofactor biosynthesis protein LarB [Chitinivibrionales bacterium]
MSSYFYLVPSCSGELPTVEQQQLKHLLERIAAGDVSVKQGMQQLRDLPFNDVGFAKVDHHRALRTGHPEVIFCQGKTVEQVTAIAAEQIDHGETVFGTRASEELLDGIAAQFPDMVVNRTARCFYRLAKRRSSPRRMTPIPIAAAGTADLPVAEEARCTVEVLGYRARALYDVGVSGIHRLFAHRAVLEQAPVVVVVAGMEGALPSVVTGLVSCPVIGVPTSVGYGSHLGGLVPLFAMLNSCASGLTVVNIDNGFGAGFAAVSIARTKQSRRG